MADRERRKTPPDSAPPEETISSPKLKRVRKGTDEQLREELPLDELSRPSDVHPAMPTLPAPAPGPDTFIAELLAVAGSTGREVDARAVVELREQIIHAEKLATIGRLATGVVHELNNPLTSISVNAEYLLRQARRNGAPADDIEKLSRIVEASDRILRFTRDLMSYARPQADSPRAVAIDRVVEHALVFCEHIVAESEVTIERQYASNVPPIHAIEGQLHQVIINLVTNACHAMNGKGGTIVIATGNDDSSVWVSVRDDGAGIPKEVVEKIFEPFYSTKAEGVGTGLGLSIVRNIVAQHGGTVSVASRENEGTTFEIILPRISDR